MGCTTALIVTAVAGIVITAASVYAAHRQAKWMAEMDERFKNRGTVMTDNTTDMRFAQAETVWEREKAGAVGAGDDKQDAARYRTWRDAICGNRRDVLYAMERYIKDKDVEPPLRKPMTKLLMSRSQPSSAVRRIRPQSPQILR